MAVEASDAMLEGVLGALALRVFAAPSTAMVDITYEVRDRRTKLDVVRIDAQSCELIDTVDSVDGAADLIADDIHRWVAEHQSELLLVHSGAVEWKGAGIVVPGRSHHGKSSLVVALLEAGATYLSDEFAPLDRVGNVHPYPIHLSLRDDTGAATLVAAADLSAATSAGPVPVRLVVDAPYVVGALFNPVVVRGAGALMILADNALVARSRPAHTRAIVAGLVSNVMVLRSPRGDAAMAARVILDAADVVAQVTR